MLTLNLDKFQKNFKKNIRWIPVQARIKTLLFNILYDGYL